jgi:flagellin-specific chaperone FliS
MKIRDIIGKGRERRFRGPRKPRLKQVGFHKKMKNLLDAELQEEDKNTHLDHAEELVFIQGTEGIKRAVGTFTKLLNTLDGEGGGDAITTKWDGSPAVFAGTDPEDGKFFVGTKGVFAQKAKLNKSPEDIETNHPDTTKNDEPVSKAGLRSKLNASLEHLKDLGIEGVLQGDLLFTKGDLKQVNIEGKPHLAFKPNTITYVVPADSETAKEMQAADIGIVFHTSYSGNSMDEMKATFGFDASKLRPSKNVWFTDARIKDVSGQVQLSKENSAKIRSAIKELSSMSVDANTFKALNQKIGGIELVNAIKAHANAPIRSGQALEQDADKFAQEFLVALEQKFDDAVAKLKTGPEGKAGQAKLAAKSQVSDIINNNKKQIADMYRAYLKTEAVKMMFQKKMKNIKAIDSFIEQPDGSLKVTDPEGFVIVDHIGRAMKIVDRLEFSAANFAPRD